MLLNHLQHIPLRIPRNLQKLLRQRHRHSAERPHLVLQPGTPGRALADFFRLEDGKVVEQWLHPGDAYAGDEFWND